LGYPGSKINEEQIPINGIDRKRFESKGEKISLLLYWGVL